MQITLAKVEACTDATPMIECREFLLTLLWLISIFLALCYFRYNPAHKYCNRAKEGFLDSAVQQVFST